MPSLDTTGAFARIETGNRFSPDLALLASAAEGARYAANADRSRDQGEEVTRRLIRDSLADSLARHVTSGVETVDGASTVYVQVEATFPVIAFFGPSRTIRVRGHALEEGP